MFVDAETQEMEGAEGSGGGKKGEGYKKPPYARHPHHHHRGGPHGRGQRPDKKMSRVTNIRVLFVTTAEEKMRLVSAYERLQGMVTSFVKEKVVVRDVVPLRKVLGSMKSVHEFCKEHGLDHAKLKEETKTVTLCGSQTAVADAKAVIEQLAAARKMSEVVVCAPSMAVVVVMRSSMFAASDRCSRLKEAVLGGGGGGDKVTMRLVLRGGVSGGQGGASAVPAAGGGGSGVGALPPLAVALVRGPEAGVVAAKERRWRLCSESGTARLRMGARHGRRRRCSTSWRRPSWVRCSSASME
jgi:hypothetical protein